MRSQPAKQTSTDLPIRQHRFCQAAHKTLFLSDLHLGAQSARPDLALRFLLENPAETVYLVGDIVDHWHPLGAHWPRAHHQVLLHILGLARNGARVIYIPGNHDAFFRQYAGTQFGGIEVASEATHIAADGRRYLVTHGDCCDVFAARAPVLARIGSVAETAARRVDGLQKRVNRRFGRAEWTAIHRMIDRTNATIRARDRFEERLITLARKRGFDGIICGHFHQPRLHEVEGIVYANCGDWVGSNTALVEGVCGGMRLLGIRENPSTLPATSAPEDEHLLVV